MGNAKRLAEKTIKKNLLVLSEAVLELNSKLFCGSFGIE
jgi:hypothetical protein